MGTGSAGLRYEIALTDSELSKLSIHLKHQLDYVKMIIACANFFLENYKRKSTSSKFIGKFVLKQYSKAHSRVFIYHQNHKYVSFALPFRLRLDPDPILDCEGLLISKDQLDRLELIIVPLMDINGNPKKYNHKLPITIADIEEDVINNCDEPGKISKMDFSLLSFLMTQEPGYIRYDFDPNHANGHIHPQHHLDINYSTNASYKYGLYENIDIKAFENIFFKEAEKQYLHTYHSLLEPITIDSRKLRLLKKHKRKKKIHKATK